MADPGQVALVAELRFRRPVGAERVRVGDRLPTLGVRPNLVQLQLARGQRPAADTALERRSDQGGVLQVAGTVTMRAPVRAAGSWQRSMLSRMNSTSPARSAWSARTPPPTRAQVAGTGRPWSRPPGRRGQARQVKQRRSNRRPAWASWTPLRPAAPVRDRVGPRSGQRARRGPAAAHDRQGSRQPAARRIR